MSKRTAIEALSLFETPQESPGYLLWRVSVLWRSSIEETLKAVGLTHPQFVVLATTAWLTRNGEHVNQIDISKSTGLDPNTTSQVLRSLESKSLIKRTRSLNERSKNPALTELGLAVVHKALPAVESTDMKFFETLSLKEREQLLKLFQKLIL